MKTAGIDIALHHVLQSRFINGNNTFLQILYLLGIYIHTSYIYAGFGKTCTGYESNISGSYNCYIHFIIS